AEENTNNKACCQYTSPCGKAEFLKQQEEENRKKDEEAQKLQAKTDLLRVREEQRIKGQDTKVFNHPLSRYTRKDDLRDIAACFGLKKEEYLKAKNADLIMQIKAHMQSNPILQINPRFSHLYGCTGRKQQEVEESGRLEGEEMNPELPEPEEIGFSEDEDVFMVNIDPSLH
ncbi:hypothetical protein M422DRAFT_263116, partial [Sphaerobolus stellatus SS14]